MLDKRWIKEIVNNVFLMPHDTLLERRLISLEIVYIYKYIFSWRSLGNIYRKDRKFGITWSSYQGSCLYANGIAQNRSAACSSVGWCKAREYSLLPNTITQPTFSANILCICVSVYARNIFFIIFITLLSNFNSVEQ